jgi:dUTP pyrophosphatase
MKLQVQVLEEAFKVYYNDKKNYEDDSGFDVYVPINHVVPSRAYSYKIPLGIAVAPDRRQGLNLYSRSSTGSKTPLRLCNHVGVIDANYRGEIIAFVDNVSDQEFIVDAGTRMFQICAPDLIPMSVEFTDNLPSSERGANGFGSTGKF